MEGLTGEDVMVAMIKDISMSIEEVYTEGLMRCGINVNQSIEDIQSQVKELKITERKDEISKLGYDPYTQITFAIDGTDKFAFTYSFGLNGFTIGKLIELNKEEK